MDQPRVSSNRVRTLAGAAALLAAAGGAAFWAWRKRAPLSRTYRRAVRRRAGERGDREPNPEREPGTDPI